MDLPVSVVALAAWSPWTHLALLPAASRLPGVYLAATTTALVYVGMAEDRRGAGLRGRMTAYCTGKAAVSGLGRAVDRAVNDEGFLHRRLAAVAAGEGLDAKGWAALAMREAGLSLSWATTTDPATAVDPAKHVLTALHEQQLRNLRRS